MRQNPVLIITAIFSIFSHNLYAAPCESKFVSGGNFITGSIYKTYADLPNTNAINAFDGALADIVKTPSWKILAQDKANGVIQAVQADSYNKSGKVIPLNINIVGAGSGAKISIDYVTPAATLSPESAIKIQFCQTIAAAESGKGATNAAVVTQAGSIKTAQMPKVEETKTEATGANLEYVKNGMPCLAEVCLGDGIAELQKIKWDKVKKETVNKSLLEYVNTNFRGKLKASTPYLRRGFSGNTGIFDSQALSNLHTVIADCVTQSYTLLSGTFTSKAGNPTEVVIRLVPSQDNLTQKWTVVTIRRTYKTQSLQQSNEVIGQLKERYANFSTILNVVKEGEPQVYIDSINPALTLSAYLQTAVERARLHPACEGSAKVNID